MERNPKDGYEVKVRGGALKRYCQTMDLKDNPALIAEYRKRHSEGEVWTEVLDGIREVGIVEMEIYILGTRLFMVVEAGADFQWDEAMARLARLPRQAEWEESMAQMQSCEAGQTSGEKWQMMERMFHL